MALTYPLIQKLLPIFAIISLGYGLEKKNLLPKKTSDILINLIFYCLLPIALFFDVSCTPIKQMMAMNYLATYCLSALFVFTTIILLCRYTLKKTKAETLLYAMLSHHANTGFIGIPVFIVLLHQITPIISIMLIQTFCLTACLCALECIQNKQGRLNFAHLWRNPIILSVILGLCCNHYAWQLSTSMHTALDTMNQTMALIALCTIGLALGKPSTAEQEINKKELALLTGTKTILHPLISYGIGMALHLPHQALIAIVLASALPSAQVLFIVAKKYHTATDMTHIAIFLSTCISLLTITLIAFFI